MRWLGALRRTSIDLVNFLLGGGGGVRNGWVFNLTVRFVLRLVCSGLVFRAYGGKSEWSFLLAVPPPPEIGFGHFYLWFPNRN